ncbi:MAG: hypothetical protein R3D84_04450 [Paracoccaceae bacterium]
MMTRWLRPLAGFALALILALTSLTLASARGQLVRGQIVEICSTNGLIQLELDENGKPVGRPHLCPDLVLSVFSDAGLAPDPVAAPASLARRHEVLAVPRLASTTAARPRARGPPLSV